MFVCILLFNFKTTNCPNRTVKVSRRQLGMKIVHLVMSFTFNRKTTFLKLPKSNVFYTQGCFYIYSHFNSDICKMCVFWIVNHHILIYRLIKKKEIIHGVIFVSIFEYMLYMITWIFLCCQSNNMILTLFIVTMNSAWDIWF